MSTPGASGHQTGPDLPLFEARGVHFAYPDGHFFMKEIDLKIRVGERLALAGGNGAGKSTLARLFTGFLGTRSGHLLYKGGELGSKVEQLRRETGILFQDPDDQLFCATLLEDVAFGPLNLGMEPAEAERYSLDLLQEAGLRQVAYKPAQALSYGQKRRAALAAVLAMGPENLILDEPGANLDFTSRTKLLERLEKHQGGLILISHDPEMIEALCHRVVVLEHGQVSNDFGVDQYLKSISRPSQLSMPVPAKPRVPAPEPRPHLISLKNYSCTYENGCLALDTLDLDISPGESIAIIGDNGAGKSTLAACLAGVRKGEGGYFWEGRKLDARQMGELWQRIGMVFQHTADQLFCPTCLEEVSFGPERLGLDSERVRGRALAALHHSALAGVEERAPMHLSGGQQRRLAIAAVLAMQPEVLVLDEPLANLDAACRSQVVELVAGLAATKVIVSHDRQFIKACCTRVIKLQGGKIVEQGRVDYFF